MNINGDRLWARLQELGQIGKNEQGGMTRLSFTEEEKNAKELLRAYLTEAGLKVWEDEIGNLFARKEGTNSEAPAILIGSHIDSVFNGGIFDGPAGVLTGIEVLQTLQEKGVATTHPIEIVAFTDEEGARFSSGMLGSKGVVGELTLEELEQCKDNEGVSAAEAMKKAGFDPNTVHLAKRNRSSIKNYLELHIEQGKVLESANLPVGVVTGIVGVTWLKVTMKGEAGHAGTTPMHFRKDPLVAAAKVIQFVEENAKKEDRTVTTVGRIQAEPGGINIIPGEVSFTLDIRDLEEETLTRVESEIRDYIATVCEERALAYEIEELHRLGATICSPEILSTFKEVLVDDVGQALELPSGAGHDAMVMASITDVGMIFVRSKDGISHHPKEWSSKEDIAAGAEVMYKTVLTLDQVKENNHD